MDWQWEELPNWVVSLEAEKRKLPCSCVWMYSCRSEVAGWEGVLCSFQPKMCSPQSDCSKWPLDSRNVTEMICLMRICWITFSSNTSTMRLVLLSSSFHWEFLWFSLISGETVRMHFNSLTGVNENKRHRSNYHRLNCGHLPPGGEHHSTRRWYAEASADSSNVGRSALLCCLLCEPGDISHW